MLSTALISTALVTATMAVPSPAVNLMAQPEPDPSWGDEEAAADDAAPAEDATSDDAVEDAAAENTAAEPAAATAAVQPADALTTEPIKPTTVADIKIPEQKGLGFMITAGALGAVGWGVMGWRVARIKRLCTADDVSVTTVNEDNIGNVTGAAEDCFLSARGGNAGLWVFQALPNAVNWGIAPAAATVRAKYDAARSAKTGEINRKPNIFIGTGAALLGAGAIGRIVVAVVRIRSLNPVRGIAFNCLDGADTQADEFFECYADRNALLYGMHQLTSAGVAAGAGLLAYGVVYKRERKNYEKNFGAEPVARMEFSVAPQLSLNYTGVSANFRF